MFANGRNGTIMKTGPYFMIKKILFLLVGLCFSISCAHAQEMPPHDSSKAAENIESKDKKKIVVGIFITNISKIDLGKKSVNVGFCLWWRSPYSDCDYARNMEIVDACDVKINRMRSPYKIKNDHAGIGHFSCDVLSSWEVTNFPFDRQQIVLSIESTQDEFEDLQFVPDTKNSGVYSDLILHGWTIVSTKLIEGPYLYKTGFDNPDKHESVFSRISMVIELKRLGGRIFFNYFVGFFLAAFLCGMTFCVETSNLMARLNLNVASIFVAVGNKYILDQSLPLTSVFSLADAIQLSTFFLITLTVSTNVACNFLHKTDHSQRALFFNKYLGITMILCYVSYLSYMVLSAIYS